jgi:hypothetical protein
MRTDRQPHPSAPGYADKEPTKPPNWHGLVAWDMFLNAASTGLFLAAALSELSAPTIFTRVAAWAYPLAVVLLLADQACLVLDLGDPLRFHHMLRVFKPLSPMSLGTWFLTAYTFPLAAAGIIDVLTLLGILPADSAAVRWTRMVFVAAAIPLAFGTAAYKGVLFSTSAQPGWRDARWLGGYHIFSALALGTASLLALAVFASDERAVAVLRPAAALLLGLSLIPQVLVTAEMWGALTRRYPRGQLAAIGGITYVVGVLAPLAALAIGGSGLMLIGVVLALAGGFASRHAIVMLPQPPHHAMPGRQPPSDHVISPRLAHLSR